jgi:hypothetical protein
MLHCTGNGTNDGVGHCVGFQTMSKRYQVVRDKIWRSEGGFIEAFRMAIVEFTNLGERRFDLDGYPHASEEEALMRDWAEIGKDLKVAEKKVFKIAAGDTSRDDRPEAAQDDRNEQADKRRRFG